MAIRVDSDDATETYRAAQQTLRETQLQIPTTSGAGLADARVAAAVARHTETTRSSMDAAVRSLAAGTAAATGLAAEDDINGARISRIHIGGPAAIRDHGDKPPAPASPFAPLAYVDPTPPPPAQAAPPVCFIGTADGDVAALCPADTDTVSYVDDDGNYVFKDLQSGEVTVSMRPGPVDGDPQTCWLPTAGASRSICGPDTTSWMYPKDGFLITEELGPDGKPRIGFQTPAGPLVP